MTARLKLNAGHRARTMPNDRFFVIVGATIREIREREKVSAADLAKQCFITASSLHHIEDGSGVSTPTLVLIAHALGISLNEIVTMEASDALLGDGKSEAAE